MKAVITTHAPQPMGVVWNWSPGKSAISSDACRQPNRSGVHSHQSLAMDCPEGREIRACPRGSCHRARGWGFRDGQIVGMDKSWTLVRQPGRVSLMAVARAMSRPGVEP
jgi:hypothetical protein